MGANDFLFRKPARSKWSAEQREKAEAKQRELERLAEMNRDPRRVKTPDYNGSRILPLHSIGEEE